MTPAQEAMLQEVRDSLTQVVAKLDFFEDRLVYHQGVLDGSNGRAGLKTKVTLLEESHDNLIKAQDRTATFVRGLFVTAIGGVLAIVGIVIQSILTAGG